MPTDQDTVIADVKAEARAELVARASNRKAR